MNQLSKKKRKGAVVETQNELSPATNLRVLNLRLPSLENQEQRTSLLFINRSICSIW